MTEKETEFREWIKECILNNENEMKKSTTDHFQTLHLGAKLAFEFVLIEFDKMNEVKND